MINLEKAIDIVNDKYPELLISTVGSINGGWIFSFESQERKKLRISPVFVSERTGEIEVFFPPNHTEELKDYNKINL